MIKLSKYMILLYIFLFSTWPISNALANNVYYFGTDPTGGDCFPYCEKYEKEFQEFEQNAQLMEQPLRDELKRVEDWMAQMQFKPPYIPRKRGNLLVVSPNLYSKFNPNNKDHFYYDWNDTTNDIYNFATYSRTQGLRFNYDVFAKNEDDELIIGPSKPFIATKGFRRTIAHELQHGVQAANDVPEGAQNIQWIQESMANHLGAVYIGEPHDYVIQSSYSDPLHQPDNIYGRQDFFHIIAKELNDTGVQYYPRLDARPGIEDGDGGLTWLDGFLHDEGKDGLALFYHRVIARYITNHELFGTQPDGLAQYRYEVPAGTVAGSRTAKFLVRKVAAHYNEMTPNFIGDWSQIEPEKRVFLNIIEMIDSDRPDDTRLSVRQKLIGDDDPQEDKFIEAIYASSGHMAEPYNIRVSNVHTAPQNSEMANVILGMRTELAGLKALPKCMAAGQPFDLLGSTPSGVSPGDIHKALMTSPARILAAPGMVDSVMVYHAPEQTGDYELKIQLMGNQGDVQTVSLGTTTVKTNGCQIKMTAQDESVITYDHNHDYVEMTNNSTDGAVVYISKSRIATYSREEGWIEVTGPGKAAMMSLMKGKGMPNALAGGGAPGAMSGGIPGVSDNPFLKQFGLPELRNITTSDEVAKVFSGTDVMSRLKNDIQQGIAENPFLQSDGSLDLNALSDMFSQPEQASKGGRKQISAMDFEMHRMPLVMSERFKWPRIKNIAQKGGYPKRIKSKCPPGVGGGNCFQTVFLMDGTEPVNIIYQRDGLPVQVNFGEGIYMNLRYGFFNIPMPPYWP